MRLSKCEPTLRLMMVACCYQMTLRCCCHYVLQVTEADISYTVSLVGINGGGRLDDQNTDAILTIRHNDDPISFSGQIALVDEGSSINVTVTRGNRVNGMCGCAFNRIPWLAQ